jgi:hypothetical protein
VKAERTERFEWTDKSSGEVLFDSLLFVGPSLLATYACANTVRQVGVGFLPVLIFFVGLTALAVWHFASWRRFVTDENGFSVCKYIAFVLVSKRTFAKNSIVDMHVDEWRGGLLGGTSYVLLLEMCDGRRIVALKSADRADLHRLVARITL